MRIKKRYILNTFLSFYLIIGFYLSINTGITSDEIVNLYIWSLNLDAIKEFFGYNNFGYSNLYEYDWRYKGVGFFYFSHIYLTIIELIIDYEKTIETADKNNIFIQGI